MAHNLNNTNGMVSFASTQTAWHGLGQIVDGAMTTAEAIKLGGCDYQVQKKPLYLENGDSIETHRATVRMDTNQLLGVVGSDYEVLQNSVAFDFMDTVLDDQTKIETVGALGNGERIFITAKLPHKIVVGTKGEDLTEMYLLLTTSHDGSCGVRAGLTPVRVVCNNTLSHALSKGLKNNISIRHTKSVKDRLEQAGKVMRHALNYQMNLEAAYNVLYKKSVSDSAMKDLVKMIVQGDKNDNTRMTNILDKIEASYFTGVGQEQVLGTAWGVFNAITHYTCHEKTYKNQETRFNSLVGGDSERLTTDAFNVLLDYSK